jgi:hypothetical protein
MNPDPFTVLGLPADATAADVQRARRRLAKQHHPDVGGDEDHMRRLNAAVAGALQRLAEQSGAGRRSSSATPPVHDRSRPTAPGPVAASRDGRSVLHDAASFTIEALPAESFEALLVVTTWIGETLVDDPPYLLEAHLYEPVECWCRLDLVPDAGSCTVGLTVAAVEVGPAPDLDLVRDRWVSELNRLDWDRLEPYGPLGRRDSPPPS